MYIDKNREIINSSTHNIPSRLKQIDKGYFLVRNHATCKFEVHNREQIGNTFCLSIPYDELDERTVRLVRETRIEYIDNIMAEMERNNDKIEKNNNQKFKDMTNTVCRDVYKYLNTHESKTTIDKESDYFKEVVGY